MKINKSLKTQLGFNQSLLKTMKPQQWHCQKHKSQLLHENKAVCIPPLEAAYVLHSSQISTSCCTSGRTARSWNENSSISHPAQFVQQANEGWAQWHCLAPSLHYHTCSYYLQIQWMYSWAHDQQGANKPLDRTLAARYLGVANKYLS